MESRYVVIPCHGCSATTVVVAGKRLPRVCARCRAPFRQESGSFEAERLNQGDQGSARRRPRLPAR